MKSRPLGWVWRWQLAQSLRAQISRDSLPCRAIRCSTGAWVSPFRHRVRRRPGRRCWKLSISSSSCSALAGLLAMLRLLWYSSSRAALLCARFCVFSATRDSRVRCDSSMASAMALKLNAICPSSSMERYSMRASRSPARKRSVAPTSSCNGVITLFCSSNMPTSRITTVISRAAPWMLCCQLWRFSLCFCSCMTKFSSWPTKISDCCWKVTRSPRSRAGSSCSRH